MSLTIAYTTCRYTPRIEWFYESLLLRLPKSIKPKVVIVDAHQSFRKLPEPPQALQKKVKEIVFCEPKPSVWQGPYRKTLVNFFSASNARNTALCHADWGYIAYCDDCSVLMPQWFDPIAEAMAADDQRVVCGTFKKVSNLRVQSASSVLSLSYDPHEGGEDYRWKLGNDKRDVLCSPRFLLGCTSAMHVSSLITVNGWPEYLCDGLGYEDCMLGLVMGKHEYPFFLSRRMMELECEDSQRTGTVYLRIDPGTSPHDKSHQVDSECQEIMKFTQTYGQGINEIGELREWVQRGNPFPVPDKPDAEWFTGIPLKDFHNYKRA